MAGSMKEASYIRRVVRQVMDVMIREELGLEKETVGGYMFYELVSCMAWGLKIEVDACSACTLSRRAPNCRTEML